MPNGNQPTPAGVQLVPGQGYQIVPKSANTAAPPDLYALAAAGLADAHTRAGVNEGLRLSNSDMLTSIAGALGQSTLEAGDRSRGLDRDRMAQQIELQREAARQEAALAAERRLAEADIAGEDFMFQLGQARAKAAAEAAAAAAEEEEFTLSDFGSQAINSEVGRLLSEDPTNLDRLKGYDAALSITSGPGSDVPDWVGDYDSARDIYQSFVADPQNPALVVEQMRELYGGDRDLAALALYNLGFFDTVGATQSAG